MNQKESLVTGASSGIGAALSRDLVARGFRVFGVARSKEALQGLHKELGEAFIPIVCDVSQKSEIEQVSQELQQQGHVPTFFFLNAGIAGEKALENPFEMDLHERIMAVNYFGVLHWVQAWEKTCKQNGGATFVVTGSVNSRFAPPMAAAYCASKAAISKAFESLSLTYYHTNLRFLDVCAGPVATSGLKGSLPFTLSPEKMARYMIDAALKGKRRIEPSLFYSFVTRFLSLLPLSLQAKLLLRR